MLCENLLEALGPLVELELESERLEAPAVIVGQGPCHISSKVSSLPGRQILNFSQFWLEISEVLRFSHPLLSVSCR